MLQRLLKLWENNRCLTVEQAQDLVANEWREEVAETILGNISIFKPHHDGTYQRIMLSGSFPPEESLHDLIATQLQLYKYKPPRTNDPDDKRAYCNAVASTVAKRIVQGWKLTRRSDGAEL